ncbi:hypothetical protein [Rhodopirellula baltica]|nr:hypothetical protein [Rhodopirellula baltica]
MKVTVIRLGIDPGHEEGDSLDRYRSHSRQDASLFELLIVSKRPGG